ncbi:MAG: kelch repeat-containing protein [Myxococcota bacterium]
MASRRLHVVVAVAGLSQWHCHDSAPVDGARSSLQQPLTGGWVTTSNQAALRQAHTITPMLDGRLLIVGGAVPPSGTATDLVEIYDPATDRFSTGPSLPSPRYGHSAVLLRDGRVLVVGGYAPGSTLDTTEIYSPATGAWTAGPTLNRARWLSTLTRLADGRVLAAAGANGGTGLLETDVLDADATAWTLQSPLNTTRTGACATLLTDGRVMVAGGRGSNGPWPRSVEVFNPDDGTWTVGPDMSVVRWQCSATLLLDGNVLIVGGIASEFDQPHASAEIFHPSDGTITPAADMTTGRLTPGVALLPDGTVLVAGKWTTPFAEIYDPLLDTWTEDPATPAPDRAALALTATGWAVAVGAYFNTPGAIRRNVSSPSWRSLPAGTALQGHSATLLADGAVLLAGGADGTDVPSPEVKRVDAAGTETAAPPLGTARAGHTATLLPDGRVLVVGGQDPSGALSSVELLDAAGTSWSAGMPTGEAHTGHTATLRRDGTVLVTGGGVSTEIFVPGTDAWVPGMPLDGARSGLTATPLANGELLIVGGSTSDVALRGDGSSNWVAAGNVTPRAHHSTTLLSDGRGLVVGGEQAGTFLDSVEISDVDLTTWTASTPLPAPRAFHTASLLSDGRVLVVGGENELGPLGDALLFDPTDGTWMVLAEQPRARPRATTLADGMVLVTGSVATSGLLDAVGTVRRPRPTLDGSPTLILGRTATLTGTNLEGVHTGSNGTDGNAPMNHPVVTLETLEGLRVPVMTMAFSDGSVSFQVPLDAPIGYAAVRVSVGATWGGQVVRLRGNNAPTVSSLAVDAVSGMPVQIHVAASDADGDPLSWTLTSSPQHGEVSGTLPDLTYSPSATYAGVESLTVQVSDGLTSVEITVTINIDPPVPVITSPAPGAVVTTGTLSVEGTAVVGLPVSIREDATVVASGNADTEGHFAVQVNLPDGQHTLVVAQQVGDVESVSEPLTITMDQTGPVFTGAASGTVAEAVSPDGAVVNYTPPTANDDITGVSEVTCAPPPGAQFPLGETTVTCSASDDNGNVSTTALTVEVQDNTVPSLTCPADITVEAEDANGATVTLTAPVATDAADDDVAVTLDPPSGHFNVGTTTVTATAQDDAGNMATCTFRVVVTPLPPPDAGTPTVDAGADAGTPSTDASMPEVDAGTAELSDAGNVGAADASSPPPEGSVEPDNCGCSATEEEATGPAWLAFALALLATSRRNRGAVTPLHR